MTPPDENAHMAQECLDMVRDALTQLGTDMTATAAMMYPEAIQSTVFRYMDFVRTGELVYNEESKSYSRADGKKLDGTAPVPKAESGGTAT